MSKCWVVGRKATIQSNGHEYLAEPYLVFETEPEADAACDLVEKVSHERPGKAEAGFWRRSETAKAEQEPSDAR